MIGTPIVRLGVTNTAIEIHGRPCFLMGGQIFNTTAGLAYAQFFDARAADVVVGTTEAVLILAVSPSTDVVDIEAAGGLNFNTALSVSTTTTATGNTGVVCNVSAVVQ
jgi:hypothetical protein